MNERSGQSKAIAYMWAISISLLAFIMIAGTLWLYFSHKVNGTPVIFDLYYVGIIFFACMTLQKEAAEQRWLVLFFVMMIVEPIAVILGGYFICRNEFTLGFIIENSNGTPLDNIWYFACIIGVMSVEVIMTIIKIVLITGVTIEK